jgi:integral membrane protein
MNVHIADRPNGTLIRAGLVVFAIGLIAIVVTFIDFAIGDDNRPLWQNLLCVLAPIGFGLAVAGLVRNARAENRSIAAAVADARVDRSPIRVPITPGRTERWFVIVAVAEATSWLLLIVATIVKYTEGNQVAVHILGPAHGALFTGYVVLALIVAVRLRWNLISLATVLVESVVPGGGYLVARRRDLAARNQA